MTYALRLEEVAKTYANGTVALKSISMHVEAGDFFALLGPNGAGKSTTIGIISSLINKSAGKVFVFDTDTDKDFPKAKSYIGLVPQEFNFNVFEPVEEVVINQAGYYGIDRAKAKDKAEIYLNQLGLWAKRKVMARELSGGMKRRLMIARALVHEPKLLILDEPTAGVDIEIRRTMWSFLKEKNAEGITIILTTHYLEEAESLCRNIAIIDNGELVKNTSMKKLLSQLQLETFIFDLAQPMQAVPAINACQAHLADPHTLEVEISKESSLNHIFEALSSHGIEVTSMRNKTNRLEQLFMGLVANKPVEQGKHRA